MGKIILASASPRRKELLKQICLEFSVVIPDIDETNTMNLSAGELVKHLAYEKALNVADKVSENMGIESKIVIGADTVVVKDGILGKPMDRDEAFKMLKTLQGHWHDVITGLAVLDTVTNKCFKVFETTHVKMKMLSDYKINAYIDSGESLDKAGAYGIQGLGAVLVEKIEGCYFNVVGLPLARLSDVLGNFDVEVL